MAAVTIATHHPYRPRPAVAAGRARPERRVGRATYVRRRLAAAAMVLAVVLVTAQAGAALGGSTHEAPGRAPAFAQVIVRPGDSLWSVAERLAPGEDPRPVVDALADARRGAPLLPGETIRWAG
jgi:hypothetical protein